MAGVGVFPVPWPYIAASSHGSKTCECEREWFCVLTSLMDSGAPHLVPSDSWERLQTPTHAPLSLPRDEQLPVIWWACFFFRHATLSASL